MGIRTPDLTPVDPGAPRIEVALPDWPQEIWGPAVRQVDDKLWEIYAPYSITTPVGTFNLPAGFRGDFASVPRALWWLAGNPFQFGRASPWLHDAIYHYGGHMPWGMIHPWRSFNQLEADMLFRDTIKAEGKSKWRQQTGYHGVRIGGGRVWARRTKGQGRHR